MFRSHWPLAWRGGADWLLPTLLTVALATAATLSWRAAGNGLSTNLLVAVALMGGWFRCFTFQLSGHPWQIRPMHMYFFAALACLVAIATTGPILGRNGCRRPASSGAEFIIPAAIFPGGADFGRVVLHAGILILEACVLLGSPINWRGCSRTTAQKTAEAESATAAEARANANRAEADQKAKQESETRRAAPACHRVRAQGRPHRRGRSPWLLAKCRHVLIDDAASAVEAARQTACGRHCHLLRPRSMSERSPRRPSS